MWIVSISGFIEEDFKKHFKSNPGYYTRDQIKSKLENYFYHQWNSEMPRPSVLYLAGSHDRWEDNIHAFENPQLWSKVFTKENLNIPEIFKAKGGFVSTLAAMVDQEVCQQADLFIGNNHSSWSELVAYFFRIGRNIPAGELLLQVNDLSQTISNDLIPFCGANDNTWLNVKCNYYRIN